LGGICPQEKTRGLYGKLNKQITHITYDRTNDEVEKLGSDDREFLYNMIEEEIENFGKHIREPYTEFRDIYRKSAKLEVEKNGKHQSKSHYHFNYRSIRD
jgi:hypothetical protein